MTAQTVTQPAQPKWPGKNLDDVISVFTGDVDADVAAEFHSALRDAWAKAKAGDTLQPLLELVETWWPQAAFWTEPEGARETLARVKRYQREGLPPKSERMTSAQFRERFGV